MKTKSILIKCSYDNMEKIHNMPFYSDSPWYVYRMMEWLTDNDDRPLEIMFHKINNETQVDMICEDIYGMGIEFTRTLVDVREYKK